MNFLHDNYLNLDLTPDHAHLIHTPTQQSQITDLCPPSPRLRTKNKMGGGRKQAPLCGEPPKTSQMDIIRAGPDNAPIL